MDRPPGVQAASPRGLNPRTAARALRSGPGVIAVSVLVVVILGSGLTLFASQSSSRTLIDRRYEAKVMSGAALVTTYVNQIAAHERLVEVQDLSGPNPSDGDMRLAAEALATPAAVLLDSQGRLIRSYPADYALIGTNLTTRYLHLREAHDGRIGVSDVVRSAVKGNPIVAVAIPARSPGSSVFSAGFDIRDSPLSAYLASAFPHPTAATYVTDAAGVLVATPGGTSSTATIRGVAPSLAAAMRKRPSGDYRSGHAGAEQFYASAPVVGTPWVLVATIPVNLLDQTLRGAWFPWVLLSIFTVVGALALLLMGRVLADRDAVVAARQDLESARDVALQATAEKSAFLAMMSHEIRTPMNAVIGMTGLLLGTSLDGDQQEFVETVRSSGESLLGIINDVLDFSKIEAGGLELENQAFNLRDCVEDAIDLAAAANTKGIELLGDVDNRCPTTVIGDVTRLRQVLVNLLGNAVKFTEHGRVVVTVEPTHPGDGETGLRVSVADTGIGIPADRLASLFDSFSQVDRSTTRLYGGTGLGLAISQQLVGAMGGVLAVESVSGQGSTFSFSLMLDPSPDQAGGDTTGPASVLTGRSALIIDDDPTSRTITRRRLEGWGMAVTDEADVERALARIDSGTRFDIALVDVKAPVPTGQPLVLRLRAHQAIRGIPVILVSSRADRAQIEQPEQYFAVLTKPLRSARLRETMVDGTASGQPLDRRLMPRTETSEEVGQMRILLVEDNTVNQRVGRLLLEKLGHLVDVVGNGLEAVDAVTLAPYGAVFMDIQMPEMDGLTATTTIRSRPSAHGQPYIVGLTASVLIEDHQACVRAGMDDFLTKPARLDDYRTALSKARPRDEPSVGPEPSAP